MLDLQARTSNQMLPSGLEQELHRAHAHVVNVLEQRATRSERLVRTLSESNSLFDQLLVATLPSSHASDDVGRLPCARRARTASRRDGRPRQTLDEVSAQVGVR